MFLSRSLPAGIDITSNVGSLRFVRSEACSDLQADLLPPSLRPTSQIHSFAFLTLFNSFQSYTYPPAQALTLLAPGLCGLLSVLSISSLFGYIGYKHFSGSSSGKAASNFFIRNPLGIVLLSVSLVLRHSKAFESWNDHEPS